MNRGRYNRRYGNGKRNYGNYYYSQRKFNGYVKEQFTNDVQAPVIESDSNLTTNKIQQVDEMRLNEKKVLEVKKLEPIDSPLKDSSSDETKADSDETSSDQVIHLKQTKIHQNYNKKYENSRNYKSRNIKTNNGSVNGKPQEEKDEMKQIFVTPEELKEVMTGKVAKKSTICYMPPMPVFKSCQAKKIPLPEFVLKC